eukprot:4269892-Amphidinium_carterae.1
MMMLVLSFRTGQASEALDPKRLATPRKGLVPLPVKPRTPAAPCFSHHAKAAAQVLCTTECSG